MVKSCPTQTVIDRLLISKNLLEGIIFLPIANPDRYTIAKHVLTSHDTAELAIAGIASHLGCTPNSQKTYLMDYFSLIKDKAHPNEVVSGRDYFSNLNVVRNGIKHEGLFPDPKQWYRVAVNTYDFISSWCQRYLDIGFSDLDESFMISDPKVKNQYDVAKKALAQKNYKGALEGLACALYLLYENNKALRNLSVGVPRAEDAIRLSAFGVHANEYLVMQEFFPHVYKTLDDQFGYKWDQNKFGHYANWRKDAVEFCLKTLVNVALRIQDADSIPGAIHFDTVYEYKFTALVDDVEIVEERRIKNNSMMGLISPTEEIVVLKLKKGEFIRGKIIKKEDPLIKVIFGEKTNPIISIQYYNNGDISFGKIDQDKVSITCVPKEDVIAMDFIRDYLPGLQDMEYEE